jgi:hypothetical protein
MKRLDSEEFLPYLLKTEWSKDQIGVYHNAHNAVMQIPCGLYLLRVVASAGGGWDHVSVSLANRTPTWAELEYVRKLLFKPDEVVVQYHVPAEDHVNIHPYCLHLWRPHGVQLPLPPKIFV